MTGATGFVGKNLSAKLIKNGHNLIVLTRNKKNHSNRENQNLTFVEWTNPESEIPPQEAFKDIDAVINLMGENLSEKRWSKNQKEKIFNSRVHGTANLIKGIEKHCTKPLESFISASAIGHYIVNQSETLTEDSPKGEGFLADVCHEWEKASQSLSKAKRVIKIRIGVVIGDDGGILKRLRPIFNLGLGGPIGSGNHVMSWIHIEDLSDLFIEALKREDFEGVINGVSPYPVTNKEFSKSLGKVLRRPVIFPVPPLALKVAFGEMSSIMLDSQKIVSQKLNDLNFTFNFPKIEQALQNACQRNKQTLKQK